MENQDETSPQVTDQNWQAMVCDLVKHMTELSFNASKNDSLEFSGDYMSPLPTESVTTFQVKVVDEGGDTYIIVPNKTVDYSRELSLQLPMIQDGDVGQLMNTVLFIFNIWSPRCREPTVLYEIIPRCLSGIAASFWKMIKLREWLRHTRTNS